ncbi:glutamate--cysteine ligase [Nocardioides sp. zg-1308]|uniref:Putative glutamate--cysteine ligase 2 n=1 Tax=Nocardioides renjunii TaxID=3095075 RepID=A0ABU5K8A2_9ACTN|nr:MULTISPECIES: glutamate--cysteine ligase [unclassified Nocardioides]MDZ5661199.1 glutamate--cysteine ligase [Nocardioides sp. S-58]NPD04316.1 glutamate--cysteine ligase [Nocardioides sp. zg-1308]WQQ22201.1 glutamate--cysteine ligase [Nocardioides sp. S-34]
MRSLGVEEELVLVDARSGEPRNVASEVIRAAEARERQDPAPSDDHGGSIGHELHKTQVETDTPPVRSLAALEDALRAWRERARAGALEVGARVLASGTSPLAGDTRVMRSPRYDVMAQRYGLTIAEQLVCGCHVHVEVSGADEGVGVLDRIRTWLPLLLAISANSPWSQSLDTAYESYRSQMMMRWASSGPTPLLGSADAYRRYVEAMLATDVLVDEAMVYTDARLSARHPTVEIRTADVCLDVRDTVVVAALARALVETAARHWSEGVAAPDVPAPLIRLAGWKAGRYGLTGELVHPPTGTSRPAADVVADLLEHVGDALRDAGDHDLVSAGLARLLADGTGARRQRELLEAAQDDESRAQAVVALARITAGE